MSRWQPDAEGRLTAAALTLFAQRGYDETTVADIAESAGLTKRTFFRYFADKREVLFNGSQELQERWVSGISGAPEGAGPMVAVSAGLDAVAEIFTDRHPYARMRARIIGSDPELQERELIKLQSLIGAATAALAGRGTPLNEAVVAAHTGVTVFHVAFARWIEQDDATALRRLMEETLEDLRSLTAPEKRPRRSRGVRRSTAPEAR